MTQKNSSKIISVGFDMFFGIKNFAKPMILIGLNVNQPGTHALKVEACF